MLRNAWTKIKSWFHDSETIFLARLSAFGGAVLQVLDTTDPQAFSALIGAKWFPVFLIGFGVVLECARRHRATDLK
ncbi:MAG: hypothetical protein ACTHNH_21150 [Mesorhizobium sp.]